MQKSHEKNINCENGFFTYRMSSLCRKCTLKQNCSDLVDAIYAKLVI
jgi:hypothetical protein